MPVNLCALRLLADLRADDALLRLRCLAGDLQSICVMHAAQQQRCPQDYEQGM